MPNLRLLHCSARCLRAATAAGLLAVLGACSLPSPSTHEVLQISAEGQYTLQGQPVPRAQLLTALQAQKQAQDKLLVEISASPQSSIEAVRFGVANVRAAHARISFIPATEQPS